jgi:hypothetical protein
MIDFFQCLFAGIGTVAAFLAISYGVVSGWTALSEASARKQKDTQRVLKLLEKIEANTAKPESTPSTDPS